MTEEAAEFVGPAEVTLPTEPGASPSPLPPVEGSYLLKVSHPLSRLQIWVRFVALGFGEVYTYPCDWGVAHLLSECPGFVRYASVPTRICWEEPEE